MTDHPLSRAELSDYVAVDGLILEEIKILSRPAEVKINRLVEATEPDVHHFGDIIGGLSEEQANEVLTFIQGVSIQYGEDVQEEVFQAFLRGFMVAARTSVLAAGRETFNKAKTDDSEGAE